MQGLGDQLFAHARLPRDQHRQLTGPDQRNLLEQQLEGGTLSDQFALGLPCCPFVGLRTGALGLQQRGQSVDAHHRPHRGRREVGK